MTATLDRPDLVDAVLAPCADPDCDLPCDPRDSVDGLCDPCAAREAEHLAGEHAGPDPECRFCV